MRYLVEARTVLLLTLLACVSILLAAGSAIYGFTVKRRANHINAVMDSLARGRWVQVDSGDVLIRYRAPRP